MSFPEFLNFLLESVFSGPEMASARGGIPEKLDNTIHAPLDDVDEQEWKDLFCVFLERFCLAQIESIIEKADTTIHYGVTIR